MNKISKIITGITLVAALAPLANAGDAPDQQHNNAPYRITTPFRGDDHRVVVYMKFDCPFCRQYHSVLSHWSRTLPKGWTMEFHPILERNEAGRIAQKNDMGFIAWFSAERVPGVTQDNLDTLAGKLYAIEQDGPSKPDGTLGEWNAAVTSSGISLPLFAETGRNFVKDKNGAPEEIARQLNYSITSTPTLVACGKYAITPDNASGNQETFIKLANAVLSKCMIDHKEEPTPPVAKE